MQGQLRSFHERKRRAAESRENPVIKLRLVSFKIFGEFLKIQLPMEVGIGASAGTGKLMHHVRCIDVRFGLL
jgi:hypothetical protein